MFNWGIMGGGWISHKFAEGIEATDSMKVYALASASGRNPFEIKAEKNYGSYDELLADPLVDAVYIGTLNNMHYSCIRQCLLAGKPVLCEKPITINARELSELLAIAKEKNVFFMEAMWTRFLPAAKYIRDILKTEEYGKANLIQLSFGNPHTFSIPRLEKAEFGGGALLDVGVYCLSMADYWLDSEIETINSAWAHLDEVEKVDLTSGVVLTYKNGALVDGSSSIERNLTNEAYIVTDTAEFRIPYLWRPTKIQRFALKSNFEDSVPVETLDFAFDGNGYQFEALEVMRCVKEGLLESPVMSWDDSLKIMKLMDDVRSRCGIIYPQD